MKTCTVCRGTFYPGDKLIANCLETFTFKPADVPDTVNPAKVSASELADSRKEHKKTAMSERFFDFQIDMKTDDLLNMRHMVCSVSRTGDALNLTHPIMKHAVRYSRGVSRAR